MPRIEYAVVRLNDGLYDEELREKLGTFFDTAVNCCSMRGQDAANVFIASGLAEQLEYQNPGFVAGRSGTEMLMWALSECGLSPNVPNPLRTTTSADYWTGSALALFQLSTGWRYAHVFERMSYADLREICSWSQDGPEEDIVRKLLDELRKRKRPCALREARNAAGFTQSGLAELAGISMRSIQQYEEGKKDINKAAAGSVQKLARILGCRMEDLLEPVC